MIFCSQNDQFGVKQLNCFQNGHFLKNYDKHIPYPRILEKNSKSREMSKRHSWKKNPAKIPKIAFWEMSKRHFWKKIQTFFLDIWSWIFEKNIFRELSKRPLWKKNPDLKSGLDFFSRNDAYSFPEIRFFRKSHQNNWNVAKWIIFPEMTLPDVPKRVWIFFFRNDASSFPGFSGVIIFITWYLTLMTSRDLGHVT